MGKRLGDLNTPTPRIGLALISKQDHALKARPIGWAVSGVVRIFQPALQVEWRRLRRGIFRTAFSLLIERRKSGLIAKMSLTPTPSREWIRILATYREPHFLRSVFEILVTLIPLALLWGLAWISLSGPRLITLALALGIGFFLMRIFCLQHDCGHYALFKNRRLCDALGRCLGVLTITPYDMWRAMHASHHKNVGNLQGSNLGEVVTLSVARYRALPPLKRLAYRVYRNPAFLFVVAPFFLFFIQYRLPFGLMRVGRRYWISALGTDFFIGLVLFAMYSAQGWAPIVWIFLPSTLFAAFAGVWTFYAHHQFEGSHFYDDADKWQLHDAALKGSSYVVMPAWLQWFTGNISIHHIHHLYARIAFYRLPQVLADHPELAALNRMTLGQSLQGIWLNLWDTDKERLVSFAEADQKIDNVSQQAGRSAAASNSLQ